MMSRLLGKILIFPCVILAAVLLIRGASTLAISNNDVTFTDAEHSIPLISFSDAPHDAQDPSTQQQQPRTITARLDEALTPASLEQYSATHRRFNIAVSGIDSRIGETYVHTDANHVLSISLDSGFIEVISVPRDTYVELGLNRPNLNILANVRSRRGMNGYMQALADIAGVGEISHYIEIGFSQALGVIEFLGFKESQHTLRVLRTRKIHAAGDFQRVHTQGQFIAQAITRNFHRFDGVMGDILISSGLLFVNSNVSASEAKAILEMLRNTGFLSSESKNVTTRVMPHINIRFQQVDFANQVALDSLYARVLAVMPAKDSIPPKVFYARHLLWDMLITSRSDSTHPRETIRRLQRPFEQRAWMQVTDSTERAELRRWFGMLLSSSYRKIGRIEKADGINKLVRREVEFFKLQQL